LPAFYWHLPLTHGGGNRSVSQYEIESLTLVQLDLEICITQLADFSIYAEFASKATANLSGDERYDRDSIRMKGSSQTLLSWPGAIQNPVRQTSFIG
jgi:hypothetical protein